MVGRAISNSRHNWVLATKLANPMGDDPNRGGLSRRWVLQAADESLKRLGTDYIDIYYLHKEDHSTPLDETVRAMGELIRQGKVRYFGVSNYRAWRVAEICNICDRLGIDRPVVSQPYYNAMNRMPEVEHFPACDYYGLGIVPYSPLARGVLTGKYAPDAAPDKETRAGPQRHAHDADRVAAGIAAAGAGDQAACRSQGHHRRAVRGVLGAELRVRHRRRSPVPRTEAQWDDYVRALDYRFTAEDEALIDRLVAPRPSLDAGLQRSGLSDRGAAGADGGVRSGRLTGSRDQTRECHIA